MLFVILVLANIHIAVGIFMSPTSTLHAELPKTFKDVSIPESVGASAMALVCAVLAFVGVAVMKEVQAWEQQYRVIIIR
jgi:hypothetical protein